MAGRLRDPGPHAHDAVGGLAAGTAGTGDPGGSSAAGGSAAPPAGETSAQTSAEPSVRPLPDAPVGAVEEWSLDQLHRRASEVGLAGRWDMTREQLVAALREP